MSDGGIAEAILLKADRNASTDALDKAFNVIFDTVQEARRTGDTQACNAMLAWARDHAAELHLEALIPCLRLTTNMRNHLDSWPSLLAATRPIIEARGENADTLLCGLE